jgi:hypothetical protein
VLEFILILTWWVNVLLTDARVVSPVESGVSSNLKTIVYANFSQTVLHKRTVCENDSLSIQYIDLTKNDLLFKEVSKFIHEQNDSSQLFRSGFGYISIGNYKFNQHAPVLVDSLDKYEKDIILSFTMATVSFFLNENSSTKIIACSNCFPLYYSFIENRLILIYDQNMKWLHQNNYSIVSKKNISRLVRKTLLPALDSSFEFKGIDRQTYFISEERRATMNEQQILENASFTLNKSKSYIQYFDGTARYTF